MQVTLTSLNPPIVREINKYSKETENLRNNDRILWQKAESSLKEWELSEESREKLVLEFVRENPPKNAGEVFVYQNLFLEWAKLKVLEVEIKDNKAWIV
jgi:hypothetical protein